MGKIISAIAALDVDVTSVEAARLRMELVADLTAAGYERGIGPGVWGIHPRVPAVTEMTEALSLSLALPGGYADRLWVNPDCGLKTRGYVETEAVRNLVMAARRARVTVAR